MFLWWVLALASHTASSCNQPKQNEIQVATKQMLSHRGPHLCLRPHIQNTFMPAAPNDKTTDTQESQIKSLNMSNANETR